jgi:tRNA (guanine-N7-)-methyltransferase
MRNPTLELANHLPIQHPEYRYSTSKNPYAEKLKTLAGIVYSDHETENQKGTWRSQFPHPATENPAKLPIPPQLHVEIGCNAGHVILEWAARNPGQTYIGIDWKFKPIFRAADKAKRRGVENLKFLRAHAERLPYIFGPHEIDALYLFFPDPWPKKCHHKNRYIHADRLRTLCQLIKPHGTFHIKTDHPGYFDCMLEAIEQVKDIWAIIELSRDLHQGIKHPETLKIPEVTLFESLFIRDQIPIQSVLLKRLA